MDLAGPRAVRGGEVPALFELVDDVFTRASGRPHRMRELWPLMYDPGNQDNLRVMVAGGRPVSHVGILYATVVIWGHPVRLAQVGSVATASEYRNRGLASRLMQDALAKIEADGVPLLFVSGDRSLYPRHGCHKVGTVHRFQAVATSAADGQAKRVAVRESPPEAPDELIPLYQREPVRFLRPREEFGVLLQAAGFARAIQNDQRVLLVERGGITAAYWILAVPRSGGVPRPGRVLECAGSRADLAARRP